MSAFGSTRVGIRSSEVKEALKSRRGDDDVFRLYGGGSGKGLSEEPNRVRE
jgi:hypothetical protein